MSTLEQRFQSVMGGMIGNESFAESLEEKAAGDWMAWGQIVARRIVDGTDGLDDAAAEEYMAPRLRALRLIMRALGRWVGEAKTLDSESRLALWNRVGDPARVVFGESFVLPAMEKVLAQLPTGATAQQVVARLVALFDPQGLKG